MAPRGRSRKVGRARIDAALDAMKEFEFPRTQVRAMFNKLIRVYGGDVGYRFIEADGYKVLLDAIIEEQDSKREKASVVKIPNPNSGGPSTSIEAVSFQTPITLQNDTGGENKNGTEAAADNDTDQVAELEELMLQVEELEELTGHIPPCEAPLPPPVIAATSPPPPPPSMSQRRKPCYGWISDDEDGEEEEDFVMLTPMECLSSPAGSVIRRPTRRSRWDLGPEDM